MTGLSLSHIIVITSSLLGWEGWWRASEGRRGEIRCSDCMRGDTFPPEGSSLLSQLFYFLFSAVQGDLLCSIGFGAWLNLHHPLCVSTRLPLALTLHLKSGALGTSDPSSPSATLKKIGCWFSLYWELVFLVSVNHVWNPSDPKQWCCLMYKPLRTVAEVVIYLWG